MIPTAAPNINAWWIQRDLGFLATFGFDVRILDLADAGADIHSSVAGTDLLFLAGGNTFVLLDHLRRTGFDVIAADLVRNGVLYVGSSAGTLVAGPEISPAALVDSPDAAPGLRSTLGMALVDHIVMPHADNAEYRDSVARIVAEYSGPHPMITLNDDQAAYVDDGPLVIVPSPAS